MEKYEELFNPSFLKKESAAKDACDNRPPLPKDCRDHGLCAAANGYDHLR